MIHSHFYTTPQQPSLFTSTSYLNRQDQHQLQLVVIRSSLLLKTNKETNKQTVNGCTKLGDFSFCFWPRPIWCTTGARHDVSETIKKKKKWWNKGTLNREGLKRGIWRPCCSKKSKSKPSEFMKVREIHLIGLRRELDGVKSSTAASKELTTTVILSFMC